MSPANIGFVYFLWAGFTLINRVLEGVLLTSAETTVKNSLTVFSQYEILNWTIPVPNLQFISGIARLLKWDYSYFGGYGEMITFFLVALTASIAFGLFITAIGTTASYFIRR